MSPFDTCGLLSVSPSLCSDFTVRKPITELSNGFKKYIRSWNSMGDYIRLMRCLVRKWMVCTCSQALWYPSHWLINLFWILGWFKDFLFPVLAEFNQFYIRRLKPVNSIKLFLLAACQTHCLDLLVLLFSLWKAVRLKQTLEFLFASSNIAFLLFYNHRPEIHCFTGGSAKAMA